MDAPPAIRFDQCRRSVEHAAREIHADYVPRRADSLAQSGEICARSTAHFYHSIPGREIETIGSALAPRSDPGKSGDEIIEPCPPTIEGLGRPIGSVHGTAQSTASTA